MYSSRVCQKLYGFKGMPSKISLFTKEWCEIIFEGKNKEYGGYVLRRDADKRHRTALILVVVSFSLAASLPVILDKARQSVKEENVEVATISKIKLEKENFPDMPEEPITAEDIHNQGEEKPEKESKTDLTGSVKIESDRANGVLGSKPQEEMVAEKIPVDSATPFLKMEEPPEEEQAVPITEDMPLFNGKEATSAFKEFIVRNLRYPESVVDQNIEGVVYVQFVVERDGTLSNIKIIRGVHPYLDNEVIRVVKSSQGWTSGKHKGKPVRVAFTIPIVFQMN